MTLMTFETMYPSVHPQAFIADNASVIGNVRLEKNTGVWFGAVLRGDSNAIVVGEGSNIQDLSVLHVDHDHALTLGQGVTVGHRAILHGCTIEDRVLVGMGAIIMNGVVIGTGSIIGAGALIPEGVVIPPNSLVIGFPGKVKRTLSMEEIQSIGANAEHYVKLSKRYQG
ncbi:MAG: gamma carbonic anhydrase family protein [Deltaproteobacteria bacterium]|nr:gamma carbonic anhydrase family protein [Deltaproteobacteria bacterium]